MPTCVIIDGNNLAHFLYNLGPSRLIPLEVDGLLVDALGAWARGQSQAVEVELCLDPRREKAAGNAWVTVFTADHGRQADGMIVGKVSHRVYAGDACLVVTSDQELQARVAEYQVRCIAVWDFVVPSHLDRPTFIPLPAKIPKGVIPHSLEGDCATPGPAAKGRPRLKRRPDDPAGEYDRLVAQTLATRRMNAGHAASEVSAGESARSVEEVQARTEIVRLTVQSWPAQPGAKFLKESFCPRHFPEVSVLFKDAQPITSEDLPILAEFLLEHCGVEADFVRRGGCLMDRVRLALLRAAGGRLTWAEIARQTGDSLSDVRRKVRQAAGRWVTIEDDVEN